MNILGIHDGHSSSAALVKDGYILSAIQEERITKKKNQGGFPTKAIKEVLRIAKLDITNIDLVAFCGYGTFNVTTREDVMAKFYRKFHPKPNKAIRHIGKYLRPNSINEKKKQQKLLISQKRRMEPLISSGIPISKICFIEHHSCHAATAYFGQPDRDRDILVITNDGAGDGLCATVNIGSHGKIKRIAAVPQSESIAEIYSLVTYLMGFVPLEHEYKLMGMAPYAFKSKKAKEICNYLRSLFIFDTPLTWRRAPGVINTCELGPSLQKVLNFKRFDDIAAGLQMFIEGFVIDWISSIIKETDIHRLALSGGLFMNVKLNKLIMEHPDVESVYIFPSCSDESNSIGAAWAISAEKLGGHNIAPLSSYYLGGNNDNKVIQQAITNFNFNKKVKILEYKDIERIIAQLLAAGKVVARCKGPMEFGARALGNRSILANPKDWKVIKIINDMIKMRDFWMPFAPSILAEDADKYIINPKKIDAPYMIMAFDTQPNKLNEIIAVTHPYDGSCRPQFVYKDWNPDYYRLINHFKKLTGESVILNTSFNLHGLPIVYSPEDALEVFDRSGLQYLALGNFMIQEDV